MEKHGKLLRQYGNRHFNLKFNPLDAASPHTAGDVQVLTLTPNTPAGLLNHWQLGMGLNMTSFASSRAMTQRLRTKSLNARVTRN